MASSDLRRALLDTDTFSEILKRKDSVLVAKATQYASAHGLFTLTWVTAHEIVSGLTSKDAHGRLRAARHAFEINEMILPGAEDYERSGEVCGLARRRGLQVETNDTLIGAVAERLGLPVATGNVRHFEQMRQVGLQIEIEDWRQPAISS